MPIASYARRRVTEATRSGAIGADPQQTCQFGLVVDQFLVPGLDRREEGDHRLACVALERAVLGVLLGGLLWGAAGRGGEDVEQAADPGLGCRVVAHVRLGVGHGALELAHDVGRGVEHHHAPGVALGRLRHLRGRILEVHHTRPGLGSHGLGHDEGLAEAEIEPDRRIAGDLDVLALIVADRHLVGVVEQDVGRLQRRVREQPGGDELTLALRGLVLELSHPRQLAVRQGALHHPGQLGVLGDVALHEHRGDVGVEPDREQHRRQLDGRLADDAGLLDHRQRVQIDDPVEDLVVLPLDPVAQRTQVVPQMDVTGRLDAREHASHAERLPTGG